MVTKLHEDEKHDDMEAIRYAFMPSRTYPTKNLDTVWDRSSVVPHEAESPVHHRTNIYWLRRDDCGVYP